jgi:ATP-dependent exoDNAse (exonuclease V) alpha subunit
LAYGFDASKALGLKNGDRMRVKAIVGPLVSLEFVKQKKGRPARPIEIVATKPLHLEHAYASTVHSAQGLTAGRMLMSIDTRSRTTSLNLFYVALSRPEHEARLYTNSGDELEAAISRRFGKTTALEIVRERQIARKLAISTPAIADGRQAIVRQRKSSLDGMSLGDR